tara:strand:+ start:1295 stop:2413 length:1119 start_codon:yes stop_codon:yes gene_type:complete
MKLRIERANLLTALSHVQNAVERRNTIPILSNVLLSCQENNLSLTATDLDLSIVENVSADIVKAGATTTPAHLLYEIVRKLPDGADIQISKDDAKNQLKLESARSSFSLPCLPMEDYPALASNEMPLSFSISATDLRHLVDKTRFAISTEETRYYLNGIYLHYSKSSSNSVLRAVATDGHRLALAECPVPKGAKEIPNIIVPKKAVSEIRRLLEQIEEEIRISVSKSQIVLSLGTTILTTKLIDGTFPDYQRVIPEDNNKTLEVNCSDFKNAVDRVSTISTEKSRAIKLELSANNIKISANSTDSGSALEEITAAYKGDPLQIGFNSRYLLDVASQIEGDVVRFVFADPVSPAIIRDTLDEKTLYVLMPMRV